VWLSTEADDQSSLHYVIVSTDVMSAHTGRRDASRGGGMMTETTPVEHSTNVDVDFMQLSVHICTSAVQYTWLASSEMSHVENWCGTKGAWRTSWQAFCDHR